MANKKGNKKSNKKSNKVHNRNVNNKHVVNKPVAKSGHTRTETTKSTSVTNGRLSPKVAADVFGASDRRLDVRCDEKTAVDTESLTPKMSANWLTTYPPKGLNNMGNTCFLNSVLQVISETHLLYEVLNERSNDGYVYSAKSLANPCQWSPDHRYDEEMDITLNTCYPLTANVIHFMRDMRSDNRKTISPAKVLQSIRKDWNQFDGWSQQDSHELLRCLLDSLKCKEVKRQRLAICSELRNSDNVDDDTKARIKSFATYSQLTPIDSVFGGQLLSSICCDECQYTNIIFEPFFDLSLPLSHLKTNRIDTSPVIVNKGKKAKDKDQTSDITDSKEPEVDFNDKEIRNLTPKERRQKRQQKKAAKREAKEQRKVETNFKILEKEKALEETNDGNNDTTDQSPVGDCRVEDWTFGGEVKSETNEFKEEAVDEHKSENIKEDMPIEPLFDDLIDTTFKCDTKDLINDEITGNNINNNFTIDEWKPPEDNNIDEDYNIGSLFDEDQQNGTNCWDKQNGWLDDGWEDNGWNGVNDDNEFQYNQLFFNDNVDNDTNDASLPVYGPELPPNELNQVNGNDDTSDGEKECDENKAQELDFNSSLELESELLLMSISDTKKLDLKQSTVVDGDQQSVTKSLNMNSPTIKCIISKCLETISDNQMENLPNFDLIRLLSNFTSIESLSGNNKYLCEMCTKANGSQKVFTNASKRALIALPPPVLTLHLKRFEAEGGYRRSVNLKKISTFVSFPAVFDLSQFVSKMYNYLQPITGQPTAHRVIYSLYGVVEHSGSLKSGHYTAFVKHRPYNPKQIKKFSVIEPFLPKLENVLKMIEDKYFSSDDTNDNEQPLINGHTMNGNYHQNGQNNGNTDDDDTYCTNDSGKWFYISDTSVTSSSLSSVLRSQAYILFYERIA
ncbi:ubiquitin carboxyl-terminal hydrolase 16-like [Oppia nitens]|uniref:ubiquitin carboxyl-terminal hydrolase 16-like n=1 Tax=Oppia nitens TaxID=1686743 RepID=UPI0023DABF6D|nr:ubiquitin carboxyl-terminal hydrolase 16-like [Oppia nitens]